jgi:hypothetical protein
MRWVEVRRSVAQLSRQAYQVALLVGTQRAAQVERFSRRAAAGTSHIGPARGPAGQPGILSSG